MTKTHNCPDCAVKPGKLHKRGCDVERCPLCGGQAISCGCEWCPKIVRLPWTGVWSGEAECKEYGFFQKDGVSPDLNRLHTECKWDPTFQKMVRKSK